MKFIVIHIRNKIHNNCNLLSPATSECHMMLDLFVPSQHN